MFALLLAGAALFDSPRQNADNKVPAQEMQAKLQGLSPAEAASLIDKLQHAQRELAAGNDQTFELLAGSPASYPAAQVAPRQAFLDMSFDRPWSIERQPAAGLWQNYELRYFPPGPRSLMWKVSVVIGQSGELIRIEMLYTAPPPF